MNTDKPIVKLCGLAREEDVVFAIEAGADALGFNFWPKSPRAVSVNQVAAWSRLVPAGVKKVGIFVNQSVEEVRRIFDGAGLDIAQLHGDESAEYIRRLDRPAWKAIHLDRCPEGVDELLVEALLIDSGTVDMPGGTGKRVDTDRAAEFVRTSSHRVILAGGLRPENVAEAIREVRPHGVDVSSGIEIRPGVKDAGAMRRFVDAALNP
ncbi:MAG: phosphoribosylanthranilate isomerase [Verrucomicrobia bacterium]|nr:phosphoribosylanthranilate isomerase [Verrucomicrobiota bacterium]MCH8512104.1 phosphoribosylanthranilate isomerase [Kiritimatiellia bacterium]